MSLSRRLLVCDDIVSGAPVAALAVWYLLVLLLIGLGVLEDDVPGVEEAGEEAEAAKCQVDQGIGTADSLLDPYCV